MGARKAAIAEHGTYVVQAAEESGISFDQIPHHYRGCFNDAEDFARDFADSIGLFGDHEGLSCYFDFEAFATGLCVDYHTTEIAGQLYVFRM